MNKLKLTLIGLALVFVSTFTNAVSISGNAAIQTDYIWRGMTQNDSETSVNVGLDADLGGGFYVGTWAATVDFSNGNTLEHDYYGGYAFEMGGIGIDIGAIQVTYNGTDDIDFSENYIALSLPMNVGLHFSEGDELGDYAEKVGAWMLVLVLFQLHTEIWTMQVQQQLLTLELIPLLVTVYLLETSL